MLLWADIIILGAVIIVSFAFGWLTFALGYVCHCNYCRKKKKVTREEFLADQLYLESLCKPQARNRIDEPQSRMAPTTNRIDEPQSRMAPTTDMNSRGHVPYPRHLYVMNTPGTHKVHLSRQCGHIRKTQGEYIVELVVCDTCLAKL
jgi:hypothetical protein